ncbi:MAG: hypothetical protein D6753_14120 [Planctomycetota bacterium]|nr:MAG: hypothetical protein D6753_14120 [Planctomycetota bacterium]
MPRTVGQVLDQEFLQVRAKILELAAFFDRLELAEPGAVDQRQLALLQQGCAILNDDEGEKAKRVQMLFSREYNPQWRQEFSL